MAIVNNFGKGVTGDNYQPEVVAEYGNSLIKIAKQVIKNVEGMNPLAVFDKEKITNGKTIEETVVGLVEGQGYDPTGAGALTRKQVTNMSVRYYQKWQRGKYETTVDIAKLRAIASGEVSAERIAENLVAALGQSRIQEKFEKIKELLAWGVTNNALVNAGTVALKAGATDYKAILKKIKNVVSGMKFTNTSFNKAAIKRSTNPSDIYILMPYSIKNSLDVDELAGVFNLDKTDLAARIIEIDTLDASGSDKDTNRIYIVDRNAILVYNRLEEMLSQLNADGAYVNYFYHIEDLFAISSLFDACYVTYEIPQD